VPVSRPTQRQPAASTTVSSLQRLQDEITVLQKALQEEKELNAKRHADLLDSSPHSNPSPQHLEIN